VLFISCAPVYGSHNLAGQITYKRIGTNTFEITLTTYTDPIARGVDRCTATIEVFGLRGSNYIRIDEIKDIPRANGTAGSCDPPANMGVFVRPRIKKNIYKTTYTFPGPGTFELRYYDLARIDNVINMTNSGATAFYIGTELFNPAFGEINNSPLMLNDPLDDACTGRLWTHNPGGYDPDGDLLSWKLINCQQYNPPDINRPVSVGDYRYPNEIGGNFTIDPQTGLITWRFPTQPGIYNISILVEEFRNGRKIGQVIRDMAIFVRPCTNFPPEIKVITDTCIRPGKPLQFTVTVSDSDRTDSVYFYLNNGGEGNNGPFQLADNPATIQPGSFPLLGIQPLQAVFNWTPTCDNISERFWQVDWYAHDNLGRSNTLAANAITKIRVVPEEVKNLVATPGSRQVTLNWDRNSCNSALGYEIYRAEDSLNVAIDTICCINGGVGSGYSLVGFVSGWDNTTWIDNNNGEGLAFRNRYCYRVVTVFPKNLRSCPSRQACIRIKRDYPILTNDSIEVTDVVNGSVLVAWSKPTELDTAFYPKPYTYKLYRAEGLTGSAYSLIPRTFNYDDTIYFDTGRNTVATSWQYKIELYDALNQLITNGNQATSIYLRASGADQAVVLSWTENVPWRNTKYYIYRSDRDINGDYQLIDSVIAARGSNANTHSYIDRGLRIGGTYCYFIRSLGSYGITAIKDPLLNDSQRVCAVPVDSTPPCLPVADSFRVSVICDSFTVYLRWPAPDTLDCASDLGGYRIYFRRNPGEPMPQTPLATIGPNQTEFRFFGLENQSNAGCFFITAIDTATPPNESIAHIFCVNNCPEVFVPEILTPNGDGSNDILRLQNRSVRSIKFWVYDRWGIQVAESTNPDYLWDGNYNGKPVVAGVYFYVLEAELDLLQPGQTFKRAGRITVIR
jgi:gliding motility-associated-like protein